MHRTTLSFCLLRNKSLTGSPQFSSVQFKVISMHSEKPICAPPRLSEIVPMSPVPMFVRLSVPALSRPFKGRSSSDSSFHASLLQAIDGVMSLALCPRVVSQAPQHFSSSEKQAACEGCFAPQPLPPFEGRSSSASSFHASLLQAIDGVMSLALCPQVVSQAPQHFRSSKIYTNQVNATSVSATPCDLLQTCSYTIMHQDLQ